MAKDPTAVAAKWQARLSAAATDGTITQGIDRVTVAPGQLAARAADLWATNTAASKPRFAANSAKVSLNEWQSAAKDKGVARIADGASKAQPKMAAFMQKLIPFVTAQAGNLPARGSITQNLQRANAMAMALHQAKGTFT